MVWDFYYSQRNCHPGAHMELFFCAADRCVLLELSANFGGYCQVKPIIGIAKVVIIEGLLRAAVVAYSFPGISHDRDLK